MYKTLVYLVKKQFKIFEHNNSLKHAEVVAPHFI